MRFLLVVVLLASVLPAGTAASHSGGTLQPPDFWSAWNWDPLILVGIALTGWLYFQGVRKLWSQAGKGRGVQTWQAAAFAGGLLALVLALISPVDALGEVLFSAHMLQHLLLVLVAAPLLVLGAPPAAVAWAVPEGWRVGLGQWWRRQHILRKGWQALNNPFLIWALHALALLTWHLPGLYRAAIEQESIHFLEHASFLSTALLFWMILVRSGHRGKFSYGGGMLFVFSMAMFSGVLGALITFSRQAWYPIHSVSAQLWGLTPLEDQQLAGVLMWVPGNFLYLGAFLTLLWRWFIAMDRREKTRFSKKEAAQ